MKNIEESSARSQYVTVLLSDKGTDKKNQTENSDYHSCSPFIWNIFIITF